MLSGKPVNCKMKQIPPKISSLYNSHLGYKGITKKDYFNYRKWLRYYLDFCSKYQHDQFNSKSLEQFLNKLKEKKQNEQQIKQAYHAVSLYYELGLKKSEKDDSFKYKNQNLSTEKESLIFPLFCQEKRLTGLFLIFLLHMIWL